MPQNVNANDTNDDDDVDNMSDSDLVKHLRKQLKTKDKDTADLASLRRENAMLKAGVDTNTKLGALFAKSFEGDLSDVEAIKTEATELGILQAATSSTDTNTNSNDGAGTGAGATGEGQDDGGSTGSSTERSNLASGAMPDDGKGLDPRQVAVESASQRLNKGDTFEKAAGGLINDLVQAAVSGDSRVIVPKGNAF